MANVTTMEQIKHKKRCGDYILLSQLLDVAQHTAKMRLVRGEKEAIKAMLAIIENRERFIKEYRSKNQQVILKISETDEEMKIKD